MNSVVRITGWRPGLEKVSMTHSIRRASGLNLAESKSCTDRVLDGETVEINVRDSEAAPMLAAKLNALGAVAEISDELSD